MSKINNQIKTGFKTYTELKTKRKTITVSPIDVSKTKERHPSLRVGHSNVIHQTVNKNLNFEVEVKVDNTKDFKFKIFCSEIFEKPFFRFDSAGASHRNNDPEIPLKDQQVHTPHFHEYNSKGIEIAYKTKALKSPVQIPKLEDINVCIMHFCEEGNMRYQKTDFPEVILQKGELGLKFTNDDPLKNVAF
jgi:hypothetical protein